MDKNTGQLPEGVKWPCYEDGTPVKFGDVIDNGTFHFRAKSFRFRENGWVIYDSGLPANATAAETGGYDDFATRYAETDSWDKWRNDAVNFRYADVCDYFGKSGKPCDDCPARNASDCDDYIAGDMQKRAIALAKEDVSK